MTFRTRVQLAFVALAVVSIGGLAVGVRVEMTGRLTAEYQHRVTAEVTAIQHALASDGARIARGLADVAGALADDNRFRLGLAAGSDRGYVLDYGDHAMRLAGLTMLQLQDSTGRIISSGHFRNEFDRPEPGLPRQVAGTADGLALVEARAPEGPFLALVRADSTRVGRTWLWLVGGRTVNAEFLRGLVPDAQLMAKLEWPQGQVTSGDSLSAEAADVVAGEIALPFVSTSGDGARVEEARLVVTQSMAPLIQLRRSVDRWSLIAGLLAIAAALLLGTWAAARLTRPLADLAEQTDRLDLARLDVEFARQRTDEVGALARVLAALTERLRRGAQQLREAERRATVGDLARQVNHDIKNGLAPIRNVLRHLAEVAEQRPEQLPAVFRERKGTLDSGVQYLETLAASYARLSPKLDRGSTDVRGVVEEVVRGAARDGVDITTEIAPRLPPVRGDAVVVRRIVENVVSNAVDAVGSAAPAPGEVRIAAGSAEAALRVRIAVTDTGPGMSREQLDRAFEDFYTTKPGGTGLGLSVVRRLVADLEGSLKVETEPGSGTTVEITLPAAEPPELPSAPPSNRPTAI
jgi:signal transduction histidine kinase